MYHAKRITGASERNKYSKTIFLPSYCHHIAIIFEKYEDERLPANVPSQMYPLEVKSYELPWRSWGSRTNGPPKRTLAAGAASDI